jgi:tetratricopeptide (TPR) repeat protein
MTPLEIIFEIRKVSKVVIKFTYLNFLSRFITKFSYPGKKERRKTSNELTEYQELVKREPWNPNAHLQLARIYENQGESKKAIAEYFLVAESFFRNGLYPNALAINKQILKQDQSLDQVSLKIATIYQKMNSLENAFSQYNQLFHYYHGIGLKEKAQEIMTLMAGLESKRIEPDEKAYLKYRLVKEISKFCENEKGSTECSKKEKGEFFDLMVELENSRPIEIGGRKEISREKSYGFEAILKELRRSALPDKVYPNLNYHIGVACSEMGFRNEAISQLQMAIEKGQNPFEAARILDTILAEQASWKGGAPHSPNKFSREKEVLGR